MNYKLFTATLAASIITLAGCSDSEQEKMPAQTKTAKTMMDSKFSEVDINKDGSFTYDEFDKVTDNKGDKEGNFIYIEMDKNGDGIISEEEFGDKSYMSKAQMKPEMKEEKKSDTKKDEKTEKKTETK